MLTVLFSFCSLQIRSCNLADLTLIIPRPLVEVSTIRVGANKARSVFTQQSDERTGARSTSKLLANTVRIPCRPPTVHPNGKRRIGRVFPGFEKPKIGIDLICLVLNT